MAPERAKPLASLRTPAHAKGLLIALAFALVAGVLVAYVREHIAPAPGRIAIASVIARTAFTVEDAGATERARQRARDATPRIYTADEQPFQETEQAVLRLPAALADAPTLGDVAQAIRDAWPLTDERLAAVRTHVIDGEPSAAWRTRASALADLLRQTPIVSAVDYQREMQEPGAFLQLRVEGRESLIVAKQAAVNVEGAQLASTIRRLVIDAGFMEPAAGLIAQWLEARARPFFFYNAAATIQAQDEAAGAVPTQTQSFRPGRVLLARGDRVSHEALGLLRAERAAFARSHRGALWFARLGALLTTLLIVVGMSAYAAKFSHRIRRNPLRALAIAGMLTSALAIGAWGALASPALLWGWASSPAIFVAFILAAAYTQRLAIGLAAMFILLLAVMLRQPLLLVPATLAGVGTAVWRLQEIRDRSAIVRAGVVAGLATAAGVVAVSLALEPLRQGVWLDIGAGALWAFVGGASVGVLVLGILPMIERLFGVTTGLTLIELRDPKQPLLRELQRRAPGTYNHALTVATIAEAAADAIGADALHLFVGALYHDIGKMHKPDYFIENQTPGDSRHDNLSPAMSLLVILGHVKDGLELAREYDLPRPLHHYIESHHGTTLVEYFYHQAKKKAEKVEDFAPADNEYRYPGPKPRTREAAILMLSDTVESAARAMADPSPGRIEALVHELAMKRLLDGQFDDSSLTLRDLRTVEASIIKSLNSIYHARIAYPISDSEGKAASKTGGAARQARQRQDEPPDASEPQSESAPVIAVHDTE